MFFKKLSGRLFLIPSVLFVLFSLLFYSFNSFARCIPAEHTKYYNKPMVTVIDNTIMFTTDFLFGERKDSEENLGKKVNNFFVKGSDIGNRNWETGMIYKMFHSITGDTRFQVVFYLCVVLLIAYLGFMFTMGMSKVSSAELLKQFIKIAIIITFVTPDGWKFYLEFVVRNIIQTSRYFNMAIIASMYDIPIDEVTTPFQPLSLILNVIFSGDTWLKILSLMFSKSIILTLGLFIILGFAIVLVLLVVVKVAINYTLILIMSAFLLSIGPIFIVCALFKTTKEYFDKWLHNLFGLFMEQYLMFLGFFIFCVLLSFSIQSVLNFEICYLPFWPINITMGWPEWVKSLWPVGDLFKNPPVHLNWVLLRTFQPTITGADLPLDMFSIGGILIIAAMFNKFIDSVASIASSFAGASVSGAGLAESMGISGMLDKKSDEMTSKGARIGAESMAYFLTGKVALDSVEYLGRTHDEYKTKADQIRLKLQDPNLTPGERNKLEKELKSAKGSAKWRKPFRHIANLSAVSAKEAEETRGMLEMQRKMRDLREQETLKALTKAGVTDISQLPPGEAQVIEANVEQQTVNYFADQQIGALEKQGKRLSSTEKADIFKREQDKLAKAKTNTIYSRDIGSKVVAPLVGSQDTSGGSWLEKLRRSIMEKDGSSQMEVSPDQTKPPRSWIKRKLLP